MKILITGTHLTPALSVIEKLQKDPQNEIIYVGRKHTREGDKTPSIESQILPTLGVKFIYLITGRLQRIFTIFTIPSLLKIPLGFIQAFYIIFKEKPNVTLSFGGYVAVPIVISSWLLSVPIIIHEQTLVSGLANTISSWFADKIAISFTQNNSFPSNKTILIGNPLRKEILSNNLNEASEDIRQIIKAAKDHHVPLVLITGGNQGSHIINKTIWEILDDLTKISFVIHQTGDSKLPGTLKFTHRYLSKRWIDGQDFGAILNHADLVVSRAGINTLMELAYFGVPTLVIPIPYLYKDEQNVNGKFFTKLGLVQILQQKDLSKNTLLKNIRCMIKDLPNLKLQAQDAKSVVLKDASSRLTLETLILGNSKSG